MDCPRPAAGLDEDGHWQPAGGFRCLDDEVNAVIGVVDRGRQEGTAGLLAAHQLLDLFARFGSIDQFQPEIVAPAM
jgi:hypothetical protein